MGGCGIRVRGAAVERARGVAPAGGFEGVVCGFSTPAPATGAVTGNGMWAGRDRGGLVRTLSLPVGATSGFLTLAGFRFAPRAACTRDWACEGGPGAVTVVAVGCAVPTRSAEADRRLHPGR